jgi:hypothetical protein
MALGAEHWVALGVRRWLSIHPASATKQPFQSRPAMAGFRMPAAPWRGGGSRL